MFNFLKVVIVLANSEDPDDMPHNASSHQGIHCLIRFTFRIYWYTQGSNLGGSVRLATAMLLLNLKQIHLCVLHHDICPSL